MVAFQSAMGKKGGGNKKSFAILAPGADNDYLDMRSRREDTNGFIRSARRTLPFQLVPQPPLAYARSSNFVGEPRPVSLSTNLDLDQENGNILDDGKYSS